MQKTRDIFASCGFIVAVAGCAGQPLDLEGGSDGPSTSSADVTTLDVRADDVNRVTVRSLPNARCWLLHESDERSDRGMDLTSDGDGVVSFAFKPASAGVTTKLSLVCSDLAGATTTRAVELRSASDVPALRAPSPKGHVRPALPDADTLSADELHALGRPARPDPVKSPLSYARWREYVSRPAVELSVEPEAAPNPHQNTVYSEPIWAGYKVLSSGSPLLSVVGEWTVPAVSPDWSTFGVQHDANFWIGLGDATSTNGAMWQGGTDMTATSWGAFGTSYTQQIWYELVIPGCTACPSTGCTPTSCIPQIDLRGHPAPNPGDFIVSELWFAKGNSPCVTGLTGSDSTQWLGYLFSNETQGYYYTGCRNVQELLTSLNRSGPSGIKGGSAEWIVERSTGPNGPLPLASFTSPTEMSNAQAYDVSQGWQYYTNRNPDWYFMVNGSDLLAYSAQAEAGTAIDFYWANYH